MTPDVHGVMAAPNRSRIKARVFRAEQSKEFPDKWLLELEIVESAALSGPNFARPGQKAAGFTFAAAWEAPLPALIEAEAEYIGDARRGTFQLSEVRLAE